MKITSIRAFMIAALIIILLYAFGLFLPIIKNSKPQSKLQINYNSIFISDKCNFKALVDSCISLRKKIIEIIIDKQHEPKIILAKKTSSK